MDFSQLEVLVAVAQEQGFSRAAERLRRTQPAISQAIRRLENELGEPLFDRSSKDGTLTSSGQVLYEYALHLLNLRRDAESAIRELRDLQRGKVVVGANEYTVSCLLPAIAVFRSRHPHIKVEVRRSLSSRIPSEVLHREYEIGVVSYRPSMPGLKVMPSILDEMVLILPPRHDLTSRAVVSVRDLATEPFVAQSVQSPDRDRVVRTFQNFRIDPNVVLELPTLEGVRSAVERGLGVAIVPRLPFQEAIERGAVAARKIKEISLDRRLFLIYRSGSEISHAGVAFLRIMKQQRAASAAQPDST